MRFPTHGCTTNPPSIYLQARSVEARLCNMFRIGKQVAQRIAAAVRSTRAFSASCSRPITLDLTVAQGRGARASLLNLAQTAAANSVGTSRLVTGAAHVQLRDSSSALHRQLSTAATTNAEAKNLALDEGEQRNLEVTALGLHPTLANALTERFNITKLFPIQAKVFMPLQEGKDVVGKSKTGTGKTLAFCLPIVDKIVKSGYARPRPNEVHMLIMEPTRELANQVARELEKLDPRLQVGVVYGGSPFPAQIQALNRGCHVVVATPGRLKDHIERGNIRLDNTQIVVLDEADEMLRAGFQEDVELIFNEIRNPDRQVTLFSATVPDWVKKLIHNYTKDHVYVDATQSSDSQTPVLITHKACAIPRNPDDLPGLILALINTYAESGRTMIFCETKAATDELEQSMNALYSKQIASQSITWRKNNRGTKVCAALHGDVSQSQRESILESFRNGSLNVLVATDVAARGIDVPGVTLVIQVGLPRDLPSYVHRSGRTGRAGQKGTAVLLYRQEERSLMAYTSSALGIRFSQVLASDLSNDEGVAEAFDNNMEETKRKVLKYCDRVQKLEAMKRKIEEKQAKMAASGAEAAAETSTIMEEKRGATTFNLALGHAEELMSMGDPKYIIAGLLDYVFQQSGGGVRMHSSYSMLASAPDHTTIFYQGDSRSDLLRSVQHLLVQITGERGPHPLGAFQYVSNGLLVDIPDTYLDSIRAHIESFESPEDCRVSIPVRLPPELFVRRNAESAFGARSRGGSSPRGSYSRDSRDSRDFRGSRDSRERGSGRGHSVGGSNNSEGRPYGRRY